MAIRLPPLNALKAFESAARHLSLKHAANELNVTPAAISHQVKALESYLGVQLFRRRNRGLELTPAARAGLPKLRDGFEALALAVAQMAPERGAGQLTVSAAPSFSARWLMPVIVGSLSGRSSMIATTQRGGCSRRIFACETRGCRRDNA